VKDRLREKLNENNLVVRLSILRVEKKKSRELSVKKQAGKKNTSMKTTKSHAFPYYG